MSKVFSCSPEMCYRIFFFFSSRRRHTRWNCDWSSDVCSSDLATYKPTSQAKYVEFVTLMNPSQFPYESQRLLPWPYVEGLRMDEAMNPLTILAVRSEERRVGKECRSRWSAEQ